MELFCRVSIHFHFSFHEGTASRYSIRTTLYKISTTQLFQTEGFFPTDTMEFFKGKVIARIVNKDPTNDESLGKRLIGKNSVTSSFIVSSISFKELERKKDNMGAGPVVNSVTMATGPEQTGPEQQSIKLK